MLQRWHVCLKNSKQNCIMKKFVKQPSSATKMLENGNFCADYIRQCFRSIAVDIFFSQSPALSWWSEAVDNMNIELKANIYSIIGRLIH